MAAFEKQARIQTIAQSDFSYNAWRRIFEESEQEFQVFADSQPEAIRSILYSFAQSGRMMNQRLLNIACEHMEFSAQKTQQK